MCSILFHWPFSLALTTNQNTVHYNILPNTYWQSLRFSKHHTYLAQRVTVFVAVFLWGPGGPGGWGGVLLFQILFWQSSSDNLFSPSYWLLRGKQRSKYSALSGQAVLVVYPVISAALTRSLFFCEWGSYFFQLSSSNKWAFGHRDSDNEFIYSKLINKHNSGWLAGNYANCSLRS